MCERSVGCKVLDTISLALRLRSEREKSLELTICFPDCQFEWSVPKGALYREQIEMH